jgi:hypothetical protein
MSFFVNKKYHNIDFNLGNLKGYKCTSFGAFTMVVICCCIIFIWSRLRDHALKLICFMHCMLIALSLRPYNSMYFSTHGLLIFLSSLKVHKMCSFSSFAWFSSNCKCLVLYLFSSYRRVELQEMYVRAVCSLINF